MGLRVGLWFLVSCFELTPETKNEEPET